MALFLFALRFARRLARPFAFRRRHGRLLQALARAHRGAARELRGKLPDQAGHPLPRKKRLFKFNTK